MATGPMTSQADEGAAPVLSLPAAAAWAASRARAEQVARYHGISDAMPDPELVSQSLPETVAARALLRPDAIAADDGRERLTYSAWIELARRYAAAIQATGPDRRPVGVMVPSGARYMAAVFGGWIAGRVIVPLDSRHPEERSIRILDSVDASLVVADPGARVGGRAIVPTDPGSFAHSLNPVPLGPDDPACIATTSGSSGAPKLVVHSNRTLAFRAQRRRLALSLSHGQRLFMGGGSPAAHTELTHSLGALVGGATLHLSDIRQEGFRVFLDRMRADRVTTLRMPVSLVRAIGGLVGIASAFAHVRQVRLSGEQVLWSDIETLRAILPADCVIQNGYSSTETVGFIWKMPPGGQLDPVRVPAGFIEPGGEALILNDLGLPVGSGEIGELVIRSRYCAIGEWIDGRCVPGRLIPDPDDPAQRVYFTGDRAEWTDDGVLIIRGRSDRQFKVNGLRVDPAEIEHAIMTWPNVRDAIVLVARRNARPMLVAFLEPTEASDAVDVNALRQNLIDALPRHMVPARITALQALPRLSSGKADAQSLLRDID